MLTLKEIIEVERLTHQTGRDTQVMNLIKTYKPLFQNINQTIEQST